MLRLFMEVVLVVITSACFAVILYMWAMGCGESYVDAEGVRHVIECTVR